MTGREFARFRHFWRVHLYFLFGQNGIVRITPLFIQHLIREKLIEAENITKLFM